MAIKQPICMKCNMEMIPIWNDLIFLHHIDNNPRNGSDMLAHGDVWQCPICHYKIGTGFGNPTRARNLNEHTEENERHVHIYRDYNDPEDVQPHISPIVCACCHIEMDIETADVYAVHFEDNNLTGIMDAVAKANLYRCSECKLLTANIVGPTVLGSYKGINDKASTQRWLAENDGRWFDFRRNMYLQKHNNSINKPVFKSAEQILGSKITKGV